MTSEDERAPNPSWMASALIGLAVAGIGVGAGLFCSTIFWLIGAVFGLWPREQPAGPGAELFTYLLKPLFVAGGVAGSLLWLRAITRPERPP